MKNLIFVFLLFSTACSSGSKYEQIGESCFEKQALIGNKFIFGSKEDSFSVNLRIRTFLDSPVYIVTLQRKDRVPSNGGPISVCHAINDRISVAFYELGEFGDLEKNEEIFISSPSLNSSSEQDALFSIACDARVNLSKVTLKCD